MHFSRAAVVGLIVAVAFTKTFGHSDPLGDIYPSVKIQHGNFVIEFENNEGEDAERKAVFRLVYSADGVLLAPRHRFAAERPFAETIGETAKTIVNIGKETIKFQRSRSEQPTYSSTTDKKTQVHNLPWPDGRHCAFEAGAADADFICVACIGEDRGLSLNRFNRRSFAPPETVAIGSPEAIQFIYDFPIVSNLVQIGQRYCIGWVRLNSSRDNYETVISTWKAGEKQPQEIVFQEPSDWNTHLSMAAIGTRVCLAYHCFADDHYPRSKIITIFQTIPNE